VPRRLPPLIGTAGWSLPRDAQDRFPGDGSHLERYARVFPCVEINSTFHRPHRASTFARWAESVPAGFRFSLKIPKTITHEARLAGTRSLVEGFLADLEPLGAAADCLLVQLPPKLELEVRRASLEDTYMALVHRAESGQSPGSARPDDTDAKNMPSGRSHTNRRPSTVQAVSAIPATNNTGRFHL